MEDQIHIGEGIKVKIGTPEENKKIKEFVEGHVNGKRKKDTPENKA